ncbi:hypothetical protein BX600DRAFT_540386 [Xylariales sp. PMI_506]|nr:hypothetical protein BX600DRAFT_540386 [Xylariales sp. PMI_506]
MKSRQPAVNKREYKFDKNQPLVSSARSWSLVDETQEVVNTHESEEHGLTGQVNSNSASLPTSCTITEDAISSSPASESHSVPPINPSSGPSQFSHERRPRKRRTLSSVSSMGPATSLSADEEVALLLSQTSVSSNGYNCPNTISTASPSDLDNIGLQLLLGAGSLLDSNHTLDFTPFEPTVFGVGEKVLVDKDPADEAILAGIYLEKPRWPLRDDQEVFLFQHYVRDIAVLFDMCDNETSFLSSVTSACPTVRATAQRHSRCQRQETVPASAATVVDENLLATIVILRYMEEVDIPFSILGPQSHLIGTRVLLAAQEHTCDFTSLRLATFWIALRQEIFMALIHSRPAHPNLLVKKIVTLLEVEDSESTYANRVILHCAACIQYCFGDEDQSLSRWTDLSGYLDQWLQERPWYFRAVSQSIPSNGNKCPCTLLPSEVYLFDPAIIGMQHYYLARLILQAHDPRTPRLGTARKRTLNNANEEIKQTVRMICGIAELRSNASISIAMAGDRFTEKEEQEALYAVLVKTEQMAWPTDAAQVQLKEVWGWNPSDTATSMSIAGLLNESIEK